MTWVITDLTVAGRLALRALGRRRTGKIQPAPDLEAWRSGLDGSLARLPEGAVAEHAWVHLPADEPPWRDSGVELAAGDEVSYFTAGRIYASRSLDIWVEPKFQIWAKIGADGNIISAARNSHTVGADQAGTLRFGNYSPNDWIDRKGARLHDDSVYKGAQGGALILVVRWGVSAIDGLKALKAAGDPDGIVSGEIERLLQGPTAPAG